MNEHIIRKRLGGALDQDRTDRERVRLLTDAEIEAAIKDDPDTWALTEKELAEAVAALPSYHVFRAGDGFSWQLEAADGAILARAGRSFGTREEAEEAVRDLAGQALNAQRRAA